MSPKYVDAGAVPADDPLAPDPEDDEALRERKKILRAALAESAKGLAAKILVSDADSSVDRPLVGNRPSPKKKKP